MKPSVLGVCFEVKSCPALTLYTWEPQGFPTLWSQHITPAARLGFEAAQPSKRGWLLCMARLAQTGECFEQYQEDSTLPATSAASSSSAL